MICCLHSRQFGQLCLKQPTRFNGSACLGVSYHENCISEVLLSILSMVVSNRSMFVRDFKKNRKIFREASTSPGCSHVHENSSHALQAWVCGVSCRWRLGGDGCTFLLWDIKPALQPPKHPKAQADLTAKPSRTAIVRCNTTRLRRPITSDNLRPGMFI